MHTRGITAALVLAPAILVLFVGKAGAVSSPAPKLGDSPPESAEGWLQRAIDAQGATGLAGKIQDLTGRFEAVDRRNDGRIEGETVQRYQRDPDGTARFFSTIEDSSLRRKTRKGFDGRTYWIDAEKSGARELRGRDDDVDKRLIDRDIDRVEMLLDLYFLDNLRGEGVELSLLEDHPQAVPGSVGILRRARDKPPAILFIDRETALLRRALILPSSRMPVSSEGSHQGSDGSATGRPATLPAPTDRFDFFSKGGAPIRCADVHVGGKREERIFVPREIFHYEASSDRPVLELWMNELRINEGLDPKVFAMPAP